MVSDPFWVDRRLTPDDYSEDTPEVGLTFGLIFGVGFWLVVAVLVILLATGTI